VAFIVKAIHQHELFCIEALHLFDPFCHGRKGHILRVAVTVREFEDKSAPRLHFELATIGRWVWLAIRHVGKQN